MSFIYRLRIDLVREMLHEDQESLSYLRAKTSAPQSPVPVDHSKVLPEFTYVHNVHVS